MEAYESFASVYDIFMDDIDYDMWLHYVKDICKKEGLIPKLGLDLGCGTGNMTHRLAKEGIDMIGIDISEQMLSEASKKARSEGLDILYLLQDMREFELYGTVDLIISLCDSLNYITEADDLLTVFKLVNNYLDPKGLFIFDLNTEYKFKEVFGDNSFSYTTDDAAYIWENYYDEEEKINEYYVNFFIKDNDSQKYTRFEEFHYEKAYCIKEIKELLAEAGLEFVACYDAFTFNKPSEESTRIYFVARENGKTLAMED